MATQDSPARVVVGSDDVGPVLDAVIGHLEALGIAADRRAVAPWPDAAAEVGRAVVSGSADFGIVMCWTGTGTAMAANKIPGVRAALCWDPWIAEGARRWNDANVLVMSLKRIYPQDAVAILDAWLSVKAPDADELENIKRLQDLDLGASELQIE